MDFSRTGLEALEGFLAWFVEFVVDHELFGSSSLLVNRFLAVDKIDWEAFRVLDANNVATTRGVFHLFDTVGEHLDVRDLGDSE